MVSCTMDESDKGIIMKNYEEVYEEFWKDIIEDEDGNIDKDALMRELSDYAFLLDEVPKVYMEVTGGKISYPNTYAYEVINEANNHYQEIYNELSEEDLVEIPFDIDIVDGDEDD